MKRRFIVAMFLVAVMVLSLRGCGSSSGTAVPATEFAQEDYPEDEGSRYTADELEGFWSSGSLTKEEIGTLFSAGEISSEVYEDFLSRMSEDVEFNAPEDEGTERPEDPETTTYIVWRKFAHRGPAGATSLSDLLRAEIPNPYGSFGNYGGPF